MTPQERIEVLKKMIDTYESMYALHTVMNEDEVFVKAEQWLSELEAQWDGSEWIDINTHLPADKQLCIVWADKSFDKGHFHRRIAKYVAETKYCLSGWVGANEVKFWMPAPPDPPKE